MQLVNDSQILVHVERALVIFKRIVIIKCLFYQFSEVLDREILRHKLNVLVVPKVKIRQAHSLTSQGTFISLSAATLFATAVSSTTSTCTIIFLILIFHLVCYSLSIVSSLKLSCHLL